MLARPLLLLVRCTPTPFHAQSHTLSHRCSWWPVRSQRRPSPPTWYGEVGPTYIHIHTHTTRAQLQGLGWRRTPAQQPLHHPCAALPKQPSPERVLELRDGVVEMFDHAFNGYMQHAFPKVCFLPQYPCIPHSIAVVVHVDVVCVTTYMFSSIPALYSTQTHTHTHHPQHTTLNTTPSTQHTPRQHAGRGSSTQLPWQGQPRGRRHDIGRHPRRAGAAQQAGSPGKRPAGAPQPHMEHQPARARV